VVVKVNATVDIEDYVPICSTMSVGVSSLAPDQSLLKKSDQSLLFFFLLGLKEKYKLTQVAIQEIVDSITNLTQQQLSAVKFQVITI